MNVQHRINLVDIKDYFNMRENNQASNVRWVNVRSLNTHTGFTLWQLFSQCTSEEYDSRYEPSSTQIKEVKLKLGI